MCWGYLFKVLAIQKWLGKFYGLFIKVDVERKGYLGAGIPGLRMNDGI